jgi:hypothetical protein
MAIAMLPRVRHGLLEFRVSGRVMMASFQGVVVLGEDNDAVLGLDP